MAHLAAPASIAEIHAAVNTLQAEAHRFNTERVEWQVERSQLQSKIAQLEAQVRSGTAMQNDLLRRTKMLEWALRQERQRAVDNEANTRPRNTATTAAVVPLPEDAESKRFSEEGSVGEVKKLNEVLERLSKPRASSAIVQRYMELLQLSDEELPRHAPGPSSQGGAEAHTRPGAGAGAGAGTGDGVAVSVSGAHQPPLPPPGVHPPPLPPHREAPADAPSVALLASHGIQVAADVPADVIARMCQCLQGHMSPTTGPVRPGRTPVPAGDVLDAADNAAAGSSRSRAARAHGWGKGRLRRFSMPHTHDDGGHGGDGSGTGAVSPGHPHAGDGAVNHATNGADTPAAEQPPANGGGANGSAGGASPGSHFHGGLAKGGAWRNTNNFPGMRKLKVAHMTGNEANTPSVPGSGPPGALTPAVPSPAVNAHAVAATPAPAGGDADTRGRSLPVLAASVSVEELPRSDSPSGDATAGAPGRSADSVGREGDTQGGVAEPDSVDALLEKLRGSAAHSWKPKMTLRGHLEVVRHLAWHPVRPLLFSASDDGTVKAWNLVSLSRAVSRRSDIDPTRTYRGHASEVLCLDIACGRGAESFTKGITGFSADLLVTGGADFAVMLWRVPLEGEPTSAYAVGADSITPLSSLVGHTNAVWDVAAAAAPWPVDGDVAARIYSASADGTLRVWLASGSVPSPLHQVWRCDTVLDRHDVIPTCVVPDATSATAVFVGTNHGDLFCLDTETGVPTWHIDRTGPSSPGVLQSINKVVMHPSLKIVVVATNDKAVRLVDGATGKVLRSINAHQGPVAGVAVDPSGLLIATASHTGVVRWWNITDLKCTQELTAHRSKWDEGALAVGFHPSIGMLATGGADACIKLFQ